MEMLNIMWKGCCELYLKMFSFISIFIAEKDKKKKKKKKTC